MNASEADYKLIRALREAGVLKNLNGDLIPAERGTIVIPCADGDRLTDLLTTHWGACNGHPCHHTLSLNGGPLLIPAKSPVARLGEGRVLLEHAYAGHKLKTVTTVVLYGHWPCGAALGANLSLYEAFEYCIKAKDATRKFLRGKGLEPTVILCFHVDYANGRKTSYFFDRDAWNAWNADRIGKTAE
jgi:hypothetical protein